MFYWLNDICETQLFAAFSETEVLANALVFFLAGYDTTSSTLAWMLYELSRHEDIQERILEEIRTVVGDNVGDNSAKVMHSYDIVQN